MTAVGTSPALVVTSCALCGTRGAADELYPSTLDERGLDAARFSARRVPDRAHFRFVRCRGCGLVRSDPIAPLATLAALYREATFTYGGEVAALRATYGRYLRRLRRLGAAAGPLLDIGCGNGFMLEEALRLGYAEARGVEPAEAVAAEASAVVRSGIVVGTMAPGLFAPESFDVVTLFQTLDHLPDPNEALAEVVRVLRPGGFVLCLNHDVAALSARLLGEHSPIFDVEHTYLYDRCTLRGLLEKHGLEPVAAGRVWNRYSLGYLAQLLPLPAAAKRLLLDGLERSRAGRLPLVVPLGNLWMAARRP